MIKVHAKLPGGDVKTVELPPDSSLQQLKEAIEEESDIAAERQRIISKGVAITEDLTLAEYGIQDEATVAVIQKKEGQKDSTVLRDAMFRYLRQFYNESDSNKITREFMIHFYQSISNLSLDDLERLAGSFLQEEEKLN